MDTIDTIKIPKLTGNGKEWFELTGSTAFKNVGATAEVGYSTTGSAPTVFKGEPVLQGEVVDTSRGVVYVLQDSYFSYEFIATEIEVPAYSITTEQTIKIVGAGQDFETLHLALRWAETLTFRGSGSLMLALVDATNTLYYEGNDSSGGDYMYTFNNPNIMIMGQGIASTSIVIDPELGADNYSEVFRVLGGFLYFNDITFDFDGVDYMLSARQRAITGMRDCVVHNSYGIDIAGASSATLNNITWDFATDSIEMSSMENSQITCKLCNFNGDLYGYVAEKSEIYFDGSLLSGGTIFGVSFSANASTNVRTSRGNIITSNYATVVNEIQG